MATSVSVDLAFERPTKTKVRFRHPDFGVLYLPKQEFLELGSPENIRVTLEAAPAAALAVAA
jgi:hypothetical protein